MTAGGGDSGPGSGLTGVWMKHDGGEREEDFWVTGVEEGGFNGGSFLAAVGLGPGMKPGGGDKVEGLGPGTKPTTGGRDEGLE